MIREQNIKAEQVIRFRQWSNKNFAVFNSLGKVIQIGFLSKIIHGLTATQTDKHTIEPGEQLAANAESTLEEWSGFDVLSEIELLFLVAALVMVLSRESTTSQISASNYQNQYSIYSGPFMGLLFYICPGTVEYPGFFYSVT